MVVLINYFAWITAAIPAQATRPSSFDLAKEPGFRLALRRPFNVGVRTGPTPFPGSLGRRVDVYSSSSTLVIRVNLSN
jgi:hypothetical protein